MRRTIISGRIANFGRKFIAAEGEKSAFAVAFVNVSMDRRDEETGYTETKAMKIIGSNWIAERLNNFEAGDPIYLEGKLEVENDYENSEGELIKGGWIVRVDYIDNWGSKSNSSATAPSKGAAKPTPPKNKKTTVTSKVKGEGIKMPSRSKKSQA